MQILVSILLFLIVTLGTATCVYKSRVDNVSDVAWNAHSSGQSAAYMNPSNIRIIASSLLPTMMSIYPITIPSISQIFKTFLSVYENLLNREKSDFSTAENMEKQHNARTIMRAYLIINSQTWRLTNATTKS